MPRCGFKYKCASSVASAFVYLILSTSTTLADASSETLSSLADDRIWRHLIFWRRDQPEAMNKDFYLSSQDRFTPLAELFETLALFEQDENARCRYPARYYWLSTRLNLPFLQKGLSDCQGIPWKNNTVSMLLIGGYLKNPVSTFGHVLIALKPENRSLLLANSYNFGARIDDNDNSLAYAFKGITGLYLSSFAKLWHFRHDQMYSQIENRDIWEFELNLSEHESKLISYHLYELERVDFDYYFFKQNCAYRSGEVLEIIEGLEITNQKSAFHSPEFVAHQLYELDLNSGRNIIRNEIFHPAAQTRIYIHFERLNPATQAAVNAVIAGAPLAHLSSLSVDDHSHALDFLLAYVDLKSSTESQFGYAALKRDLVRLRIQRPPAPDLPSTASLTTPSAAHGPKPGKLEILAGDYLGLNFSMYRRDPLNEATHLTMDFSALDISYRFQHDSNVSLLKVDLLKARKFADLSIGLHGERTWSWDMAIGLDEDRFNPGRRQHFAQGGAGAAYGWGDSLLAYQLLGLSVHDQDDHLDFKSNTGLLYKSDFLSAKLEYERAFRERAHSDLLTLTVRKRISKNLDARLHWFKQDQLDAQASLGVAWYW